jgi:hypothetical protein
MNRHRIKVSLSWTGDKNGTDVISIVNLGKKRVLIDYYQLYYKAGRFSKKKIFYSPEDTIIDITLDSNSRENLYFKDEYKICASSTQRLYFELSFIGRKNRSFRIV